MNDAAPISARQLTLGNGGGFTYAERGAMDPPPKTDIRLYTSCTPNGHKASITLEALGIPYQVKNIGISKNVQKESWFLQTNPNGRIPAIVDKTPTADGRAREKPNHFYRYAPEKIEYGIKRYHTETRRLYQVLENRLAEQEARTADEEAPWIVGDRLTIANIAIFAWVNWAEWAAIDVKSFKYLNEWLDRINERPAVKRGLDVPETFMLKRSLRAR
ncbi:MAG: hypothetical protein Q9169_003750 [Polycauliona sp. 2 TL-2023]